MVVIITPNLGLRKMKDSTFLLFAQNRVAKVPLVFPVTDPPTATIAAATTDYGTKAKAAEDGSRAERKARNDARKVLHNLLTEQANNCVTLAAGDEALYLSTGYGIKRKASPRPAVTAPLNVQLFNNIDNRLRVTFNAVANGKSYLVYIATEADAASFIVAVTGSDTSIVIPELTSGQKYFVKVRATGPHNTISAYSNVVSKICS